MSPPWRLPEASASQSLPHQSPFRRLFSVTCWPRLPRPCRRRRRTRDLAPGLRDAIAAAARIFPIVTVTDIIVTFIEVKMIMTFAKMTVIICHRRRYHRQDFLRHRDGHPCRPPGRHRRYRLCRRRSHLGRPAIALVVVAHRPPPMSDDWYTRAILDLGGGADTITVRSHRAIARRQWRP